ncbi:hypothetical protein AC625_13520 [Peribacillus loiseleuriae]|uniref:Uncharacterized protein n=1 Tax=Peribacillus loiseleuriae TaxID=1679170 RepID=A0A0K9GUN1_9BACI|nr:hypothetical protein AC625_13520 [Peribacillus loiseleuriae]
MKRVHLIRPYYLYNSRNTLFEKYQDSYLGCTQNLFGRGSVNVDSKYFLVFKAIYGRFPENEYPFIKLQK